MRLFFSSMSKSTDLQIHFKYETGLSHSTMALNKNSSNPVTNWWVQIASMTK